MISEISRSTFGSSRFEISANGPPPRTLGMTGEAETKCDRRPATIGGNRHGRIDRLLAAARTNAGAGHRSTAPRRSDTRTAHDDPRIECAPCGDRALQQKGVEIAPQQRASERGRADIGRRRPRRARRRGSSRRRADRVDRSRRRLPASAAAPWCRDSACRRTVCREETSPDRRCAPEPRRARAPGRRPTRPARRRQSARHTWPMTNALFFDPKPRQLHSAASTSRRRLRLGMTSRSQAGSASR
jgi:hypothetical protein